MLEFVSRTLDRMEFSYGNFLLKRRKWMWMVGLMLAQALCLLLVNPKILAAGFALLLLVGFTLARFEVGFLAYVCIAWCPFLEFGVVENERGFGQGIYPSEAILAFLLVAWLAKIALGDARRIELRSVDLWGLLFLMFAILSMFLSNAAWNPKIDTTHRLLITQAAQLGIIGMCLVAYGIATYAPVPERWVQRSLWAIIGVAVLLSILRLPGISAWWKSLEIWVGRDVMLIVSGSLIAAGMAFYAQGSRRLKLALLALFPALMVLKDVTLVAGWTSLLLALGVMLFLRSRMAIIFMLVGLMGFILINRNFLHVRVVDHSRATGDFHRFFLIEDCVKLWMVHPVLGVGPGNFYQVYGRYFAEEWQRSFRYNTAHTNFGELLATTGLTGFISFMMFFGLAGLTLFRNWRRCRDPVWKGLYLGLLGVFIAHTVGAVMADYLIPDRANYGLRTFSSAVYLWLALGLGQTARGQESPAESSRDLEAQKALPAPKESLRPEEPVTVS